MKPILFSGRNPAVVTAISVKVQSLISFGKLMLTYKWESCDDGDGEKPPPAKATAVMKLKAKESGQVRAVCVATGDVIQPGQKMFEIRPGCSHPTVMKDMCAECGADLRKEGYCSDAVGSGAGTGAGGGYVDDAGSGVQMVHSIPELKVSSEEAQNLGKEDEARLMRHRKLVLLVDLDQTLIHTTNENVQKNIKDVYHFQLYGAGSPWYHTRIRPGTSKFIENISKYYELHICTFGARMYAHMIAGFLDQDGKFFSHRILSRDECFNPRSKTANLSALFPCGDQMVCIIDDREDVWNFASNLVHVKPYNFFKGTADINSPFGRTVTANKGSPAGNGNGRSAAKKRKLASEEVEEGEILDENEANRDASKNEKIGKDTHGDTKEKSALKESEGEKPLDDEAKDGGKTSSVSQPVGVNEKLNNSDRDSSSSSSSSDSDKDFELECEKRPDKETVEDASEDDLVEIEDTDDYLIYLEDILKTIHQAYYDLYDQMSAGESGKTPDLKTVIPYVKRKVLQGCHLVFSGVIPTHVSLEKSRPFMLARSLGAVVSERIIVDDDDRKTTHLVAARLGTAKVNEARSILSSGGAADVGCGSVSQQRQRLHIVTPDWLWSCAERWERVDELIFPLVSQAHVTINMPKHCSSPEIAFADRCADFDLKKTLSPASGSSFSRSGSSSSTASTLAEELRDPLLAFSDDDIEGMDKEVDDILSAEDSDSSSDDGAGAGGKDVPEERDFSDDSNASKAGYDESLGGGGEEESDDDGSAGDSDSDWNDMAAELEREVLAAADEDIQEIDE